LEQTLQDDLHQFVSNAAERYGGMTNAARKDMETEFQINAGQVQDVIDWVTQVSAKIEWSK
jgi:hypothetical protein